MGKIPFLYLLSFLPFLLPVSMKAQGRNEFNGPFPSWANVKTQFGAKGNGKDDDTKAIQLALDNLSCPPTGFNMGKGAYMVAYLPAGVYCISSTLILKGKIGVSLIGEDPSRTIIKWTGGDKDTMFWANGSAYFKISRFTWDANNRKDMEGVGIHWKDKWNDGKSRSFASLNIEISDNDFAGGFRFGISGGTSPWGNVTGANDSEITIRRCTFRNCTGSGIEITGFNALDYWIWDCRFLQCMAGVKCSRGGYHAYRSFFSGSKSTDFHNIQGYYNSVRGCYSQDGNAFSLDESSSSNPFKRIFQDNTIINPHQLPVEYYHLGKLTLWGNQFSATVDTTFKFSVNTKNGFPGIFEVLSLHNIYAYKDPIRIASTPKKLYTYGDRQAIVQPAPQAFLKSMDVTPPKVNRRILEVPPGSDAAAIQNVLNKAAGLRGQRPVVHFGMGLYPIDKTLVIPAGSDMQLTGDGLIYASVFVKKDPARYIENAMILVKGPSYISIQDLQIGRDGDKDQPAGIVFQAVDQPGAQAHLDQVCSHADTSLSVREMDNLYVQKENSFFTDGNYISGGRLVQKGGGTAALYCYGGQFEHVKVENNARFMAKDCWWEGETRVPLDLQGSGTISIDGAMIAPNHPDSTTTIRIGKFNGHISLMNMYVQGALSPIPDNPGLSLLIWNIHFYHKMNVLDFLAKGGNYKGAFLGINAQCFRQNDPACKSIISIEDKSLNIQDINSFLDSETVTDRENRPVLYKNLLSGASNIYASRISILGPRGNSLVFTAK
ncbi:glycosyl hydrolase family 28-related protein [Flavitalea flava]